MQLCIYFSAWTKALQPVSSCVFPSASHCRLVCEMHLTLKRRAFLPVTLTGWSDRLRHQFFLFFPLIVSEIYSSVFTEDFRTQTLVPVTSRCTTTATSASSCSSTTSTRETLLCSLKCFSHSGLRILLCSSVTRWEWFGVFFFHLPLKVNAIQLKDTRWSFCQIVLLSRSSFCLLVQTRMQSPTNTLMANTANLLIIILTFLLTFTFSVQYLLILWFVCYYTCVLHVFLLWSRWSCFVNDCRMCVSINHLLRNVDIDGIIIDVIINGQFCSWRFVSSHPFLYISVCFLQFFCSLFTYRLIQPFCYSYYIIYRTLNRYRH